NWPMCSVLACALEYAAANGRGKLGMPIFWAVSHADVEIDRDEVCSHRDVIAVGQSGPDDFQEECAFGPKLEFLAPGVRVFSTTSGGKYGTNSGTSFACPLAAGVAALVLSRNRHWTRDQVLARLRKSCDKIGGVVYDPNGHHVDYGYGRINAERAVKWPALGRGAGS
ncbi:MAG TPA: S8 family serine peptidase, partial [Longimicrobiaceae bacterium]|nr:S8 family serine peptidase [Longimicrobiaceae bacterium]